MEMHVPAAVIEARLQPVTHHQESGIDFDFSPQLNVRFDKNSHALWSRWTAEPRPCFNPRLLADIRSYYDFLSRTDGTFECRDGPYPIEYVVLASGMPGVFNLGGDLDLFKQLISDKDKQGLLRYGRACIDVLYRNYVGHELPVTTISLVQGECLGGGFEAALSSDVIVAERSARFGFPEILFNLFPGMGAYSFLDRKIGSKAHAQHDVRLFASNQYAQFRHGALERGRQLRGDDLHGADARGQGTHGVIRRIYRIATESIKPRHQGLHK